MNIIKTLAMTAIGAAMLGGAVAPAYAEDITINLWSRADRSGPAPGGPPVRR